ncbi:hypothetical protein NDU88_003651, partial [Pleurodeles waltl]
CSCVNYRLFVTCRAAVPLSTGTRLRAGSLRDRSETQFSTCLNPPWVSYWFPPQTASRLKAEKIGKIGYLLKKCQNPATK